ncbi:MAG: hypothetical protein ACP5O6_07115 [Candidatus Baltobacteraceae bacterium]
MAIRNIFGRAMLGMLRIGRIPTICLLALTLVGCSKPRAAVSHEASQPNLVIRHVQPGQSIPGLEYWSNTKFSHVRGAIVGRSSILIPGIPIQNVDAPVVVLSCSMTLAKPFGSQNNSTIDHIMVLNRTKKLLSLVRVLSVYRGSGLGEFFVQNLKPNEMRSLTLVDDVGPGSLPVRAIRTFHMQKPSFMLCGAGPALASDGTAYEFEPPFPRVLGKGLENPF